MRLLRLINDLLDLVRLESGKMEVKREPVAIEPFLFGLANAIRKSAEDRGVRLEVISDPAISTVLTDSDKLERILLNLLFNGLKFTPAGGKVEVKAERENGELVLEVSDTGTGISEEQTPVYLRPLLASGHFIPKKIPGGGNRAGAGEGTCRGPRRERRSNQRDRKGHPVYSSFALRGAGPQVFPDSGRG